MRITELTKPKIQDYIEKRLYDEGAENDTVNRELTALKRMLNLGAKQIPPKIDTTPYIPMLAENNTRKGFSEHGEYLVLKDALPSYLKPIIAFGYKFGWRLGEILDLPGIRWI